MLFNRVFECLVVKKGANIVDETPSTNNHLLWKWVFNASGSLTTELVKCLQFRVLLEFHEVDVLS